jgi:hypothetical protein
VLVQVLPLISSLLTPHSSLFSTGDLPHDLLVLREFACLFLGVYQDAINRDFKNASPGPDELRLDARCRLDLSRQTGGPWLVVSNAAVFDGHSHGDLR